MSGQRRRGRRGVVAVLTAAAAVLATGCGSRLPAAQGTGVGPSVDGASAAAAAAPRVTPEEPMTSVDSGSPLVGGPAGNPPADPRPADRPPDAGDGKAGGARLKPASGGSPGSRANGSSPGPAAAEAATKGPGPDTAAAVSGDDCPSTDGGPPLIVGGSFPLSGQLGFLGRNMTAGISAVIGTANERGGACGRKLRAVLLDDGFDPNRQLANFRRLNEEHKVLLAVTLITNGIGSYVTTNRLPVLTLGGTMESFSEKTPTILPIIASAYGLTGTMIDNLLRQGVIKPQARIGLLYDTSLFNFGPVHQDLEGMWKKAGMTVAVSEPFNLSDGDCTQVLLKMRSANVDYIDFQSLGWPLCTAAGQRQGYRPPSGWGGWITASNGLPALSGQSAQGVWSLGPIAPPPPDYVAAIQRFAPQEAKSQGNLESGIVNGPYYLMKLFEQAVKHIGRKITRDQLLGYFQNVKTMDYLGHEISVSFAPSCREGIVPSPVWGVGQWHYDPAADDWTVRFTPNPPPTNNPYVRKCEQTEAATRLGY